MGAGWNLFRKELSQHASTLVALAALETLLLAVFLFDAQSEVLVTSPLEPAASTIRPFAVLAGLVLGHRIVVRDYEAKSQLFLEALPVRRWQIVLCKYLFGATVLSGLCVLCVVGLAVATHSPTRQASVAAVRTFGYATAIWTVFFALGLLGRVRWVAYLLLAATLYTLSTVSNFELERFGPLALADATLGYEQRDFAPHALLESAALSLVCLAMAFALALVRASAREKSGLTLIAVAAVSIVSLVDVKAPRVPFQFSSGSVVRSKLSDIAVMYGFAGFEARGQLLIDQLERISDRMQRELGVARPPPIRIAHNSALDAHEVRQQDLPDADGILLEANLGSHSAAPEQLLAATVHAGLNRASGGRALFEPQHWLFDGLCAWWAVEQLPDAELARERLWLRGILAARVLAPTAEALRAWDPTLEALGDDLASGLAFTAVSLIAEQQGRAAVLQLMRGVLTRDRTYFRSASSSQRIIEQRYESITGKPWGDFIRTWQAALRKRTLERAIDRRIADVTSVTAKVSVERGRAGSDLVYELDGPPRDEPRSCSLGHIELKPYDEAVGPARLKRQSLVWHANHSRVDGRLRGRYGSGQRILVVIDCAAPALGASVRLAALRTTIP
jgi:hypothetical protein